MVKEYQCEEEQPVARWDASSLQACGSGDLVSGAPSETLIADARISPGLSREYMSCFLEYARGKRHSLEGC